MEIMEDSIASPRNINHLELLNVLLAVKNGDFSARMQPDRLGIQGKKAGTLNNIIVANE